MMNAEGTIAATVNGWTFNPVDQAWVARVGPARWLIIHGDSPPAGRPECYL